MIYNTKEMFRQEYVTLNACFFIHFEMAPSVSVNFISLVITNVGLQEEEPQTTHPKSFTWVSYIAGSMLYPINQSTSFA